MAEFIGPAIFGLGLGVIGLLSYYLISKFAKKPADLRSDREKDIDKMEKIKGKASP